MTDAVRKLVYLSPAEIKPDPTNPRKHSAAQIRALKLSIQSFGFNAPILVDRAMKIVTGHARLQAALQLNLGRVPVICLSDLSQTQAKAYMLADNKLAECSTWDDELLAAHLQELSDIAIDFDIDALGFEAPEIDLRIQSLNEDVADTADDFNIAKGPAVSKVGDCWKLNDHVVYCGSALDLASYYNFGVKAAAVFADPPYGVPINGHVCGRGKTKHREFVQGSENVSPEALIGFLTDGLTCARANCREGGLIFCCMDWRHVQELQAAAHAASLEQINLCVWVKSNGGMGTFYRSRHELVFVFRNGSTAHLNNVQLGKFGRNRSNVWHYPGANVPNSALKYHPTPKPIALVADALLDCTARDDYVLDPFLGSGTTLLAAERTGRRAFGIELDALYVDTAIHRWQKMTGGAARLPDGKTFAEVAVERSGQ